MKNAVKIILINPKKEILLQLRDNKPTIDYPDYWVCIGGEIKKNETSLEGLLREIKEEIPNCNIKDIQDLGTFIDKSIDVYLYVFKGKIDKKIEYINQRLTEGQKVKYFRFDELNKIKIPPYEKDFITKNKIFLGI